MLAVIERHAAPLCIDIRLEGAHLRIVGAHHGRMNGMLQTPVHQVANKRNATELHLELRIPLGMGIGRIRMAHVTRDADRSPQCVCIVKDPVAVFDFARDLSLPHDYLVVVGRRLDAMRRVFFRGPFALWVTRLQLPSDRLTPRDPWRDSREHHEADGWWCARRTTEQRCPVEPVPVALRALAPVRWRVVHKRRTER